jgi:hypothetical protein
MTIDQHNELHMILTILWLLSTAAAIWWWRLSIFVFRINDELLELTSKMNQHTLDSATKMLEIAAQAKARYEASQEDER